MSFLNNNLNILPTSGYDPVFSWQVGLSSSLIPANNLAFRATIRPLNGAEQYSRLPNPQILYEETGIFINSSSKQGSWTFPLVTNAAITGGPFRNYQVVVEAHDSNGNTSAGNLVGTNNENGWVAFNQGYDAIAIYNPRQTGIEMGNNIPTQYSSVTGSGTNLLNTGFSLSPSTGYGSFNYMGAHGEINIRFLSGQFNSNLVGGYIYAWTGQFPKLDTALGINGYQNVSKSQFTFDPMVGYVYHPTAAMAYRGANSIYVSLSFYDNLDAIAIDKGINVSTGLYISDNAICYNDIAAGSITIGGFQTLYGFQYKGTADPTELLGLGCNILSTTVLNGNTYVVYASRPVSSLKYSSYTGVVTNVGNGLGGQSIMINNNRAGAS